jgi:uncharacterized protein YjhX (UPF0386 family)
MARTCRVLGIYCLFFGKLSSRFSRAGVPFWYIFQFVKNTTAIQLSEPQRELLEALAGGGIIAIVHTRGGTIASLFPREGRHRNISYKAVQPLVEAGWIEDVVPKGLRWRGSKYVISTKGLRAIGAESNGRRNAPKLTPTEVGIH